MTTELTVEQLRALKAAGVLSPEMEKRLAQLEAQAQGRKDTTSPPPQAVGESITVEVNVEAFNRGGQQWYPPPAPGVYDAVCEGVMVPSQAPGQLWFVFRNAGTAPRFRGNLVCGALAEADARKSGAWKIKDILEALGITYHLLQTPGTPLGRLTIPPIKDIPCQVEWQEVDIRGKRELRIQNVFPKGAVEGL